MFTIYSFFQGLFRRQYFPFALIAFIFGTLPMATHAAPTCGAEIKNLIAQKIDDTLKTNPTALPSVEAALYAQYSYCAADGTQLPTTDPFFIATRQCGAKNTYTGSTYFEEMACCGYDPQRRTFACPVKIKLGTGFNTAPLPGSREYVYHCVLDSTGVFRNVGVDSVHLANSTLAPTWQFAVVTNANTNLYLLQPMNNQARTARSILSWNFQPTSCAFKPIWGDVIDYAIRLDQ